MIAGHVEPLLMDIPTHTPFINEWQITVAVRPMSSVRIPPGLLQLQQDTVCSPRVGPSTTPRLIRAVMVLLLLPGGPGHRWVLFMLQPIVTWVAKRQLEEAEATEPRTKTALEAPEGEEANLASIDLDIGRTGALRQNPLV